MGKILTFLLIVLPFILTGCKDFIVRIGPPELILIFFSIILIVLPIYLIWLLIKHLVEKEVEKEVSKEKE